MTYCPLITETLKIISVRCILLNLRSKTRRRATLLLPTWIYSCLSVGTVNFGTSLYDKRDDFNFHITNFPFLSSNIQSSPAFCVYISQLIRYARACCSYVCFILRAVRLSNKLFRAGICQGTFEIVSKEVLWSVRGSYKTIWGPILRNVTRHTGWWPYRVTPFIDEPLHQFWPFTDLDLITEFDVIPTEDA